jgi:hypothetical protein
MLAQLQLRLLTYYSGYIPVLLRSENGNGVCVRLLSLRMFTVILWLLVTSHYQHQPLHPYWSLGGSPFRACFSSITWGPNWAPRQCFMGIMLSSLQSPF